ncbi:MAG: hypothetical protein ACYC1M_11190 [Armatimonadota bacterium]
MNAATWVMSGMLLMGLVGHTARADDTDITAQANGLTSTTLTANVSEQCKITVPSTLAFYVTDITANTVTAVQVLKVENIVLATATKQLKLYIKADASTFTYSESGTPTWAPADVSWNAPVWSGGTGIAGNLSESFSEVAVSDADSASCTTTTLIFTLKANTSIKRSGNHSLAVSWKVEATGT